MDRPRDCHIDSEVRKTKTNKISLTCGIKKNDMDELTCKAETQVQRINFWIPRKEGKVKVMSDSLQPHGLYSPWNSLG